VAPYRIEFLNNGRLEYAELVGESGTDIFAPPTDAGPTVAAKEPGPVTAEPLIAKEGGKMSGMKVLSVKGGSIFEKLGMRRGDILQRVNGSELDVKKGFEIFSQLKDSKTFTLDLIRQGQPKTLEYEIR